MAYGKLTQDSLNLIRGGIDNVSALYLWALIHARPFERLDKLGVITEARVWSESQGFTDEQLANILFADFSIQQVAKGIGKQGHKPAQRAIHDALERGYLVRVTVGTKGHASIYALAPLPEISTPITNTEGTNIDTPTTQNGGTNSDENTYPKNANTYPETPEYVPQFPNNGGTTQSNYYKDNQKKFEGEEMIFNKEISVKLGDVCPYCQGHTNKPGRIAKIDDVMRARGDGAKPSDPSKLVCPNCNAIFLANGKTQSKGRYLQ